MFLVKTELKKQSGEMLCVSTTTTTHTTTLAGTTTLAVKLC
jgi:hypothetical protein